MATFSTSISNDLLSSTLYSIRDGEVDELFQKVAFLDAAKSNGGTEMEDGGTMIVRPLSLVEHSSITELPTGYESVSLGRKSLRTAQKRQSSRLSKRVCVPLWECFVVNSTNKSSRVPLRYSQV